MVWLIIIWDHRHHHHCHKHLSFVPWIFDSWDHAGKESSRWKKSHQIILDVGAGGVGKLCIRLTTLLFWQWGMAIHIMIIVLSVLLDFRQWICGVTGNFSCSQIQARAKNLQILNPSSSPRPKPGKLLQLLMHFNPSSCASWWNMSVGFNIFQMCTLGSRVNMFQRQLVSNCRYVSKAFASLHNQSEDLLEPASLNGASLPA